MASFRLAAAALFLATLIGVALAGPCDDLIATGTTDHYSLTTLANKYVCVICKNREDSLEKVNLGFSSLQVDIFDLFHWSNTLPL